MTTTGFLRSDGRQGIRDVEMIGVHLTLFTTRRGSVVGSALSPVIKITGCLPKR